jgi:hypothetical protein
MAGEASKAATARTGILVLALIGIFYGMYMLGQAVVAESEATQAKLDGLILQVEALSREVRSLKMHRPMRKPAPRAGRPPAPGARPGAAPAPDLGKASPSPSEEQETEKDRQPMGMH